MNRLNSIREVLDFRLADLQKDIDSLKEENIKLAEAGHALYHALGYFTDDFNFMKERDYMFSAEKAAKKNWEELFNDIPEPNYED
jgi:hypothetical protein